MPGDLHHDGEEKMKCAYCGEIVYDDDRVLLNESGCVAVVHRHCADSFKEMIEDENKEMKG